MSTATVLVEPEDRYSHEARSYHLSGLPTGMSWSGICRSFLGVRGVYQALVSHPTIEGKMVVTILLDKRSNWETVDPQVTEMIKKIFGLTDLLRPDIQELLRQIDLQKAFPK
jgi:hypothetical protein